MKTAFRELLVNIKGGVRLCLFRKPGLNEFRVSPDQVVLLFLVDIALGLGRDFVKNLPNPAFNSQALVSEGFSIAVLLLSAYLIARFILRRETILALTVLVFSVSPVLLLAWTLAEWAPVDRSDASSAGSLIYAAYAAWALAVLFWCIRTLTGRVSLRVAGAFCVMLLTWLMPVAYLASFDEFWYPRETENTEDPYQAYRDMNAEQLFDRQPELLNRALDKLQPGRPGVTDIYFIGVGAYARQDVFLKETRYAINLFEERFDARGRTLALINHLTTRHEIPLASSTNLAKALRHVGSIMNRDEDLVVLYMTSHGSREHELSVDFWPLPLNDITPDMLRTYLDQADIKWRVVMISACYSGGFLETLKSPYSAVATAAATDRKSFGCSNQREFTYFGEALLKDQLQSGYSFPVAFSNATTAIAQRERQEKLTASNPQFFIGEAILPVLKTLHVGLDTRALANRHGSNDED
jgi:hypothetical protein